MTISTRIEVGRLADQLERGYRGGAWHGPAVRETVAGVDAATAIARPPGGANTILSLVRHMAFWLNAAHVRITRGGDVDAGDDWPDDSGATNADWASAVQALDAAHARLHGAVLELEDEQLDDPVPGTDSSVRGMLLGILQHNAYHTGQIVQIAREIRA